MDWKLSRRDFIKFAGFTAAGLTLGGLLKDRILKHETFQEGWGEGPGIESWSLSICRQCDAGCGIKIRLVDGDAKKVKGNPLCPMSRGKLCPKGESSLQVLYDPDRWVGPVRRVGKRDRGDLWNRVSWEKGVSELSDRLKTLREKGHPERLIWIIKEDHSSYGLLVQRFMKAFGSPNLIVLPDSRDPAIRDVNQTCLGTYDYPAYDFENTAYILSFGTPLLESWLSPVWIHRMYGRFRQGREKGRGRLVQVEPRLSPTAIKADEWIPIQPGMEGHLALAMAYVLIREGRYDKDFVSQHSVGFEDWKDQEGNLRRGFRHFVFTEFELDRVAQRMGVSVTKIIKLARDFSSVRPSLALAERAGLSNGFFTCWAVQCLNALVGQIDRPGGILMQRPFPDSDFSAVQIDKTAQLGLSHDRIDGGSQKGSSALQPIAQKILENTSNPPEILILSDSRFLSTSPESQLFVRAVQKIPFTVSFSSFKDDASQLADLILPDHTFLEKWQDQITQPWDGTPRYTISKPALAPILDTRHRGKVLLGLAHGLGGTVRRSLSWETYPDVLKQVVKGLYKSRRGTFFTTSFEGSWIEKMEKGGWWISQAKNFSEFWDKLIQTGGWWDPLYTYEQWRRVFRTESKRFEFMSDQLNQEKLKIMEPRLDNSGKYPFHLYPFQVLALGGVENTNQPFLQEIFSPVVDGAWSGWAELNPLTAERLGIRDRDLIWIESLNGKLKLSSRLYAGIAPNVVSVLLGVNHRGGGRWVKEDAFGVQDLLIYRNDLGKKYPLFYTTRVNIYKA